MESTRREFVLRPHDGLGMWYTDVSRYYVCATEKLVELKALHERIEREDQDLPPDQDVEKHQVSQLRWSAYLERSIISETVVVFAAMAAEAFLNLYGVVRFGESEFTAHFERLGIVPKVRQILLICDFVSLAPNDPLVLAISSLAARRNSLVHPKTREAHADGSPPANWKRPVLDNAEEAVEELKNFLKQFNSLVPDSASLMPYPLRANAYLISSLPQQAHAMSYQACSLTSAA